jgi:hypothetical protein
VSPSSKNVRTDERLIWQNSRCHLKYFLAIPRDLEKASELLPRQARERTRSYEITTSHRAPADMVMSKHLSQGENDMLCPAYRHGERAVIRYVVLVQELSGQRLECNPVKKYLD